MANEKKTTRKLDTQADDVVTSNQRQVIIDRLYGHRSTLRGILNETERIIEWLRRTDNPPA